METKTEMEQSNQELVCTLTGAEFAKRKEALQEEIFSKAQKVEELESGYLFYFLHEPAFLLKMADYVVAESICCPFFQFDIQLKGQELVQLKITGAPGVKKMIEEILID